MAHPCHFLWHLVARGKNPCKAGDTIHPPAWSAVYMRGVAPAQPAGGPVLLGQEPQLQFMYNL